MNERRTSGAGRQATAAKAVRGRVLAAAFAAFCERGYAGTTTQEIAKRARVSKRDLYALFDDKHAMLDACIAERIARVRLALDLPAGGDPESLRAAIASCGAAILRGICEPNVLALCRLAIAESARSPEIARSLYNTVSGAHQFALADLLTEARGQGLLPNDAPRTLAADFTALLWGDLLICLILGVTDIPMAEEMKQRAAKTANMLLALCAEPDSTASVEGLARRGNMAPNVPNATGL